MEKSIKKIFLGCQSSTATHPELVKKLINIYVKNDFDQFCNYFLHLMKFSLIHGEKIPAVERTLTFIAKFATSVKTEEKEKDKEEEPQSLDDSDDVDIDPFLVTIFEFLLKNHDAVNKAVRFRVCQLINQILNCMGEQASIDDHLYNTIYDTMLQRLMDKSHNVRVHSILALSRLQDPRNKECPVIKAYLFHLSMDPNPEVRKAVLNNIAITFQTLPDILDRRRDIRDTVRRQAYIILAQKVHIRSFTIAQRIMIISEGLKDRSPLVRQALKKNVLQAWLRLVDGSILELLKCLDVETSKESAELAVNSLLEEVPYNILLENFNILNEKMLIPYEKLTTESALYWICLAKHLRKEKADEFLEQILPDLTVFCDYIRKYVAEESPEEEDPQETAVLMMQKDFVCQQLIAMTTFFDLADEVGRKNLRTLIRLLFITPSVSESTIKTLSEVFVHLYQPAARVNELVEIISDIRDPPEAASSPSPTMEASTLRSPPKENRVTEEDQRKMKLKLAQISVKMNQVREELEECVRTLNLEKAMTLKENLQNLEDEKTSLLEGGAVTPQSTPVVPSSQTRMPEEEDEEVKLRSDPETLSRCLLILSEFLTSPDISVFGSILRSLHDNLILPCLKSEYEGVRRLAVRGLNLCCLVSKDLAKQYLLLLIQISKMDVEEIRFQALKGVFDIWLLYGLEEFHSAAEDVNEFEELVNTEGDDVEDKENADLEEEQTLAAKNMIPLLSKMLETDSSEVRTLTAQGLCKLLMSSQINSVKLLSQLIIMWYNPENEEDNLLRHMLGVVFQMYASAGGSNQEALGKSLIPTIHTIFKATTRSPLSHIDLDDLINFLVTLTSPSIASNAQKSFHTVNAHDSMVFSICAEILANTDREYTRTLVRSLNLMSLTPTDYPRLKSVAGLMQKIIEKVTDKVTLNNAEKFKQTIKRLLSSAPKEEDCDETQNNTLVEAGLNVTADLMSETLLQNSAQQSRRKRILYTTQSDLELISDLDSETDKSPSKMKKLETKSSVSDNTVFSDSIDLDATKMDETDDEPEKEVTDMTEIELSMTKIEETDDEEDVKRVETTVNEMEITTTTTEGPVIVSTKQSSSDLFGSSDAEKISVEPAIVSTRQSSSDLFLSSEAGTDIVGENSVSESEEDETKKHPSGKSSSSSVSESPPRKSPRMQGPQSLRGRRKKSSILDTSSSSSFYSARSSTSGTPEVVKTPLKRERKKPQEDTSPDEEEEPVVDRSLRVRIHKLEINKLSKSKKTPRKTTVVSSSISRSTRSSQSSSVSTEDENQQLRSRLSNLTFEETPTTRATRSEVKNRRSNEKNKPASSDRKSSSLSRKTPSKFFTPAVVEKPASSSDGPSSSSTRSRSKSMPKIVQSSQTRSRSRSSSILNSESVTASPVFGSSPASIASLRSSSRLKKANSRYN